MGVQFHHGFKKGLGPFKQREVGRTFPTGTDCARVRDAGFLSLGVMTNPLRTGHLYIPPDVFSVTHGYVEARMRFRGFPGAHGSVWLQALEPYASRDDHEVDVVENFGNPNKIFQGIWTQDDFDPEPDQVLKVGTPVAAMEWQVYGCEMHEDGYTFTVNDVEMASTSTYVSSKPKYLIASLLISDWEYDRYGQGNSWNQKTHIDWVRVSDI